MGISILFARGLIGELLRRGITAEQLLTASGIDRARLSDLRDTLSIEETSRLVDRSIALTGDPALGLAAGASAPEHTFQLFSHLVLAQHTAREAIATLERYSELLSDGATWSLIAKDDCVMLSCATMLRDCDLSRFLMDYTFALMVNVGRHFFPPGERLRAVHFRHRAPSYAARYAQVFHCPVLFGQELNATVFDPKLLDYQRLHADTTMAAMLREPAERLLRERAQARRLSDRVREILRSRSELSNVTMADVARDLRMSVHMLRRRLSAEGATFAALSDEVRCDLARQQLMRPGVTIQEIAAQLGFSEASAFFRAFKRWTGQTPTAFRRGHDDSPSLTGTHERVDCTRPA